MAAVRLVEDDDSEGYKTKGPRSTSRMERKSSVLRGFSSSRARRDEKRATMSSVAACQFKDGGGLVEEASRVFMTSRTRARMPRRVSTGVEFVSRGRSGRLGSGLVKSTPG